MLTPFDIKPRVEQILEMKRRAYPHDTLTRLRVTKLILALYREVLAEIARGSLDARSLAIEAVRVEK